MPWTPKYNALNLRAIADNLETFWEANQADVFTWLGEPTLPHIKRFSDSIANKDVPVYPAVAFANDSDQIEYTGDVMEAVYAVTFQLMVVNLDPDVAVQDARKYAAALASMTVNCPPATLNLNTGVTSTETVVEATTTDFLNILADEEQVEFMQRVQFRAQIRVQASIFE
jgi:hypothetical protein